MDFRKRFNFLIYDQAVDASLAGLFFGDLVSVVQFFFRSLMKSFWSWIIRAVEPSLRFRMVSVIEKNFSSTGWSELKTTYGIP